MQHRWRDEERQEEQSGGEEITERRVGEKGGQELNISAANICGRREEERGRNVLERVQQIGSGTVRQRGGQEGAREEEEECKIFPSGRASAKYRGV